MEYGIIQTDPVVEQEESKNESNEYEHFNSDTAVSTGEKTVSDLNPSNNIHETITHSDSLPTGDHSLNEDKDNNQNDNDDQNRAIFSEIKEVGSPTHELHDHHSVEDEQNKENISGLKEITTTEGNAHSSENTEDCIPILDDVNRRELKVNEESNHAEALHNQNILEENNADEVQDQNVGTKVEIDTFNMSTDDVFSNEQVNFSMTSAVDSNSAVTLVEKNATEPHLSADSIDTMLPAASTSAHTNGMEASQGNSLANDKRSHSQAFLLEQDPFSDPTSRAMRASQSANTWNTLLRHARKSRGPRWDYSTGIYQVPECSYEYFAGVKIIDDPKHHLEIAGSTWSGIEVLSKARDFNDPNSLQRQGDFYDEARASSDIYALDGRSRRRLR